MEFWILFALITTIIITPLTHCPLKTIDGYILPQIGVGAIGIGITSILFVINFNLSISLTSLLAIIYFGYLLLTNAWSTVPHNSLRDVPLIFLSVFSFIISNMLFENLVNIISVSLGVFVIFTLLALYGIAQRFCIDPFFPERIVSHENVYKDKKPIDIPKPFFNKHFQDSRVISTIGNTNFAAGFYLTGLPFLIYLGFAISYWFWLSLLIVMVAIILTECRAAILALFIGLLSFVLLISAKGYPIEWVMNLCSTNNGIGILIISIVIFLTGLWFSICWAKDKGLFETLSDEDDTLNTMLDFEGKADNSLEDRNHWISHLRYRLRYWKAAWWLIKKKPLQGYGLRTYRKEVYQAQGELNLKNPNYLGPAYQTPQPRECHNDFLENFVEGGIIGGLLFISILGIVLYHTYIYGSTLNGNEYLMLCGISSGLVAILVDVFFFFPLRLGSSALFFWIGLAMFEGITGNVKNIQLEPNFFIILFIAGAVIAMLWESVIKPNIGNYYFSCHSFSTRAKNKEMYLMKAINYCPKETIFRTHAMLGYLYSYPDEASQHAEIARQHFDGMVPGWINEYNSAISAIKTKTYEAALRYLQKSLFNLPYLTEAQHLFRQVWPLAPLKRGRIFVKQLGQETVNLLMAHKEKIISLQNILQQQELIIQNIILSEKVKQAIPPDWVFDQEHNMFIPPDRIPSGKQIIQVGPAQLPILIPAQK